MFRFAIEGATKSEMTKWLRDFFAATKAVRDRGRKEKLAKKRYIVLESCI